MGKESCSSPLVIIGMLFVAGHVLTIAAHSGANANNVHSPRKQFR